jgi:hypothetical protein
VIATTAYGLTYAALMWTTVMTRGAWVADRDSIVTRDALTVHDPRPTTREARPTEA